MHIAILSQKVKWFGGKRVDDASPSSLMDLTGSLKVKTIEGERVGARSLACSTLRG
jgi:hypothetical protein